MDFKQTAHLFLLMRPIVRPQWLAERVAREHWVDFFPFVLKWLDILWNFFICGTRRGYTPIVLANIACFFFNILRKK